eukprot:g2153.t1
MANNSSSTSSKRTPACIILGMAGAGKTTLMQRLNAYARQKGKPAYIVNLDPAVLHVPYDCQIDIRDTVDYKQLMQQYKLGPNGGIMTALNLFVTKFDQVLSLMEKRSSQADYMLLDTPGQIEVFTWSASGDIVTKLLASSFPTVLVYVIDTPRCLSPATFMSNMLYASSIFYKAQMPMVVVFNKIDVAAHDFALEWMTDFEAYQEALEMERDDSYMSSLLRSMSMVLDEFYQVFDCVGVSSATGEGVADFFDAIDRAAKRFEEEVKPRMEATKKRNDAEKNAARERALRRMKADMDNDRNAAKGKGAGAGTEKNSGKVVLEHVANQRGVEAHAKHMAELDRELYSETSLEENLRIEGELIDELEGENDEEERREREEYLSLMKFAKKVGLGKKKEKGLPTITEEK